ncbi:FadR/GntR family transcriptional regulator [Asticcacaulis sp. 201]|uniref:FadR/GntR family transcriptional regulator n=1 Tax=Asticcacaulis sp. 201 TaxID=3028787 RepID=UPI002916044D|nr:FadR/GntR family transcriptional regulator [Asticcacaulis sp. 201]MDV6329864.1 FadR/GntR family transcriptional regulator [Asticcacaulis sp. 201]
MSIPADNQKLYQNIIAALQADIAEGRFREGDRLPPERVLVERFQVSRLTIREAMIGMEILGLVAARRGSGVYVTAAPAGGIATSELDIGAFELTAARRVVEGETAALAASAASDADLAELEDVLTRMIAENAEGETLTHDEAADREFHLGIARATQNDALVLVVKTLWDVRERSPLAMEMLRRSRSAGVKPLIDDHRAILDAISARDPDAARNAMRDHLGRVIENLLVVTEMDAINRVRDETARLRGRAGLAISRAVG